MTLFIQFQYLYVILYTERSGQIPSTLDERGRQNFSQLKHSGDSNMYYIIGVETNTVPIADSHKEGVHNM